jgi:hypothetical protein
MVVRVCPETASGNSVLLFIVFFLYIRDAFRKQNHITLAMDHKFYCPGMLESTKAILCLVGANTNTVE